MKIKIREEFFIYHTKKNKYLRFRERLSPVKCNWTQPLFYHLTERFTSEDIRVLQNMCMASSRERVNIMKGVGVSRLHTIFQFLLERGLRDGLISVEPVNMFPSGSSFLFSSNPTFLLYTPGDRKIAGAIDIDPPTEDDMKLIGVRTAAEEAEWALELEEIMKGPSPTEAEVEAALEQCLG